MRLSDANTDILRLVNVSLVFRVVYEGSESPDRSVTTTGCNRSCAVRGPPDPSRGGSPFKGISGMSFG